MSSTGRSSSPVTRHSSLVFWQVALLLGLFGLWHVLTQMEVLPKFFFGEPLVVLRRVWDWFASGKIFPHLGITLLETLLAFVLGTVLGLVFGLWLALSDPTTRVRACRTTGTPSCCAGPRMGAVRRHPCAGTANTSGARRSTRPLQLPSAIRSAPRTQRTTKPALRCRHANPAGRRASGDLRHQEPMPPMHRYLIST